MPRLSEETKNARRRQIMEAARTCFSRRGFSETSMQDIITESGLSSGSIYSHFSGRDDILRQTAESVLAYAENSLMAQHPDGVASPREIALLVYSEILPEKFMQMFLQLWAEAPRNPELAALVQGNLARVRQLLLDSLMPWAHQSTTTAGQAQDRAEFYADALMTIIHGYFVRLCVDPSVRQGPLFDRLMTLVPGP